MESGNVKNERVKRELWAPHSRDEKAALADELPRPAARCRATRTA